MADIRNHLPERLNQSGQTFNQGLIKAVNSSGDLLLNQIQACIDQFFLTTANGKYLVQLGEESGFVMPPNSGLDIRAYRVLVPLMVSSPKQVRRTFEEIIEAFYGSSVTKPSITAITQEPYSLVDGDDLWITTEKGEVKVTVLASAVSDITKVTASELAATINTIQSEVYADTVADRLSGKRYMRISSTTNGSSAFIRVTGGTAQNVLKFPHVISSAQQTGTVWNVTKAQSYSDVMRIKWNGAGVNPKIYLVQKGDIMTIRGLTGLNADINGSYEIQDSGYDYVTVLNQSLFATSTTFTQTYDDQVFFTSQVGLTIYDNSEYGLASEIEAQTATVTVPAIPPLARRFLSGSAHMHGSQLKVLNFTRNSVQLELPQGQDKPIGTNQFVIKNKRIMYNFRKSFYKTDATDSNNTTPVYSSVTNDSNYSVFPFTETTAIGEGSLHCEVDSDEMIITFPFRHGLLEGWGFTLSGVSSIGNLSPTLLNKEFVTSRVVSPISIVCKLVSNDILNQGDAVYFSGVSFGVFNIYRYMVPQDDGSDFYLEFPTITDVVNSGLKAGRTFKVQAGSGTDVEYFYADNIKHRILQVQSIDGNRVNILTGLGVGGSGLITSGASGARSSDFGGPLTSYLCDLTSAWNISNVLNELTACMLAYTPSSNKDYVGSFIYDPNGVATTMTVSKYITHVSDEILKGSNDGVILIDKAANIIGNESFPQSGKLILDYGKSGFEGPINYLAVIDGGETMPSQIIIDPAYRFKKTHLVGAQVQYVHVIAPYIPTMNGSDYPVYITGTAQARNTLFKLLESLVASGVFLQPDVLLPQLRYQDTSIPPFE